jgi:hypothetical protein
VRAFRRKRPARSLYVALVIAAFSVALFARSAHPASVTAPGAILDQANGVRQLACRVHRWAPDDTAGWAAQTFTPSVSGRLTDVVLNLLVTTPQITVSLAPVGGDGSPLVAALVATVTVTPPVARADTDVEVSFPVPPLVEAGTTYALVLSSPTEDPSTGSFVAWSGDFGPSFQDGLGAVCAAGAYSGGRAWVQGSDPLNADADFFFATYVLADKQVTVTNVGSGSGRVRDDTAAIDCGQTCNAYFPDGATVTLRATPDAGSTFSGWSGACSGTTGACSVRLAADVDLSATFRKALVPVTVRKQGRGIVTSIPRGIACGGTCTHRFTLGFVRLTATPSHGFRFSHWSGACHGTKKTCRLNLRHASVLTAAFTAK